MRMKDCRLYILHVAVIISETVSGTPENVALNRPVSLNFINAWPGSGLLTAGQTVDGVITTKWPSVISTLLEGSKSSWWKVDLETTVEDAIVVIYFRTDYKLRRNGVTLYTSTSGYFRGGLCHTVTGRPDGSNIPDVLRKICPGRWRYLTIYTNTDNGDGAALDFGEVQVLVCSRGTYGTQCNSSCGHCADGQTCDHVTGVCDTGCMPGWKPGLCQKVCDNKTFGLNCNSSCGHCAGNQNCNQVTGVCDRCMTGWKPKLCQDECDSNTFGDNCHSSCGHCVGNHTCDHVTGQCAMGCMPGWKQGLCQEVCDKNKFGANCSSSCGRCADNHTCNHVTGICESGCTPGWKTELCQEDVVGTIAGVVGLFVLAAVIGGIFLCIRFKNRHQSVNKTKSPGVKIKPGNEDYSRSYDYDGAIYVNGFVQLNNGNNSSETDDRNTYTLLDNKREQPIYEDIKHM